MPNDDTASLAITFDPSHPESNKTLETLIHMFAQSVQCTAGSRGIIYVTVPITSGYNQFVLMNDLQCQTAQELRENHRNRYVSDVLMANSRSATSWSAQARSAFPGRVVLDPSPLVIEGFEQPHYYELWGKIISLYADTVVATPRWAFSLGSRKEVEQAIASGLRVVDLSGAEFTVADLVRQDKEARDELRSWGWSTDRITNSIPELEVNPSGEPTPPRAVKNNEWEYVLYSVNEDLLHFVEHRMPPVYTPQSDDERTRTGSLSTWREQKLNNYWTRLMAAGLDSPSGLGRLELASMAGTAVAMLRSTVRVYGRLASHQEMRATNYHKKPQPPLPSIDYSKSDVLTAISADVWTWIRDEHHAKRNERSAEQDDAMTVDLVKNQGTSGWYGELWNDYFAYAQHNGLDTWLGRYSLGRFTTGLLQLLESSVRLYGPIPRRQMRDVTRENLQGLENS